MGNAYGHPDKETMDKLSSRGIEVFRTDEQGTIIASSNGANITWSTEPGTTGKAGIIKIIRSLRRIQQLRQLRLIFWQPKLKRAVKYM